MPATRSSPSASRAASRPAESSPSPAPSRSWGPASRACSHCAAVADAASARRAPTAMTAPAALRTTITGSLPKPAWLAATGAMFAPWRITEPSPLAEAQDDAVRLVLADQDDAGLDIVTDGEQRRRHYIWGFIGGLTGVD